MGVDEQVDEVPFILDLLPITNHNHTHTHPQDIDSMNRILYCNSTQKMMKFHILAS